jgi:pyruvate,water dikinase
MGEIKMPYMFAELKSDLQSRAGGKAGTLAQLYQRGYPVPNGFIILPEEFENDGIKPEAWLQAQTRLEQFRQKQADTAFAVRSSASNEDSAQASFAGEFETVLDVQTDEDILQAIYSVRRSRDSVRTQAYSQAQGLPQQHEMAVVVQQLVPAELSGVLFTADPVTGNLMEMTGNFGRGLGEKLVSGETNPQTFTFDRQNGKYNGPVELKPHAKRLYRLAARLDKEMGASQDIEWATAGGEVYILQARPITTMREFNPVTGELNSSLTGSFLWSNGNAAEIQPEVMTLLTWSVGKLWGKGYGSWWSRYPMSGNIGGRNYFNISIQVAPFVHLPGLGLKGAMRYVGDWWGRIPPGITVPLAPFSPGEVLKVILSFFASSRRFATYQKQIPGFVSGTAAWCRTRRERILELDAPNALAVLWRDELEPYYCFGTAMASAANSSKQIQLQAQLRKLMSDDDTNALLSNLGGKDYLASLGPVVNVARVARGELSREAYLEQFGHRGPLEFELAQPQPVDDPAWLEQQVADFVKYPFDVEALLNKQRARYHAAWKRFCTRYPGKVRQMQAQLAEVARLARQREAARSELTRVMGVLRAFALRAGELTGLGENMFYLTIDELLAVLGGDRSACGYLAARKETLARYRALPPYPPVISGRFDPFRWAADPERRSDVYDAQITSPLPDSNIITGFAGGSGVVEGTVRRIDRMEDGHLLRTGEILVTMTTNVGWTPLFPRAAAIVTDVGAPLSHAAIVARELGIPAVVGCNDATMRLKTGDCIRVNGGQGTVEILKSSEC